MSLWAWNLNRSSDRRLRWRVAGARRLETGLFFQNSLVNNPRQTRMPDLRSMLICLPMSPEGKVWIPGSLDRPGSQVKDLG